MTLKPVRPVLEEFEPRILYSADFAPAALAQLHLPGASDQRLLQPQETPAAATATAEIAFVDISLPDAQRLIDDLQAQQDAGRPIEIVRIDGGEDGITRISDTLAQRNDLSAVHVLSHGSDGTLQLGSARLDAATLLARAGELAQWSTALSADADLLLYGCDVAASATGQQLLLNLAVLTGADVAASNDLTGAAARGGDWVLEFASGSIQAGSALSSSAQQAWKGVLLAPTNETLVNQQTANDQTTSAENRGSQQAVALDGAGNYVVVWTSALQDGSGNGVYARRFNSGGTAITDEILVNQFTAGNQRSARVVSDSAGNFVVTWTSSNQDGTANSVYARRFDGNGLALTPEARVNTTATGSQTDSVIAMNANTGDYAIAWQGNGPGDSAGIFFRRFFANGTAKDATDRLANLSNGGTENDPALTMDSSGNFVIVWEVGNKVYFQRFDAGGGALGGRVRVDNLLSGSSGAAVASDAAGNFTIVFRESVFFPGVWAKGFNADGTVKYASFQVASGDPTSPSIAMAVDGTFVVTYETNVSLQVYARNYNADGTAAAAAFAVNQSAAGTATSASVAVIDANNKVIVWSGKGSGDTQGVFARQFGTPNAAPVITSDGAGASAAVNVAENSVAVTTVTATDADALGALTYSIIAGADAARFTIDASSGLLSFVAAPNFEAPSDVGVNNVYNVTVRVSDGTLIDTQAIAVTVTPVNDINPVITSNGGAASAAISVAENSRAVTTVKATDADLPAQTLTYSISGGADAARFTINASTGVLSFIAAPNFELPTDAGADNVYDVTVQASDGSLTDTQAIAVTVTNLNDNNPVLTSNGGGASAAVNVAENSVAVTTVTATDADALGALTYAISGGVDAARFTIDAGSGLLSFVAAPNFEAPSDAGANNVYNVTVRVSDGTLIDTQAIAVTVTPVNDINPVITSNGGAASAAISVAENSRAVTTVKATDADLPAQTLTYSISGGADAARFTINASTGVLSFIAAPNFELPTDAGADNVYDVTVQASDGSLTDTQAIAVTVTNLNDNNPVLTSNGGGASAAVNVAENSVAVTTVTATDADALGALTYAISGGVDAARFTIDAGSGLLSFVAAPNFEAPSDAGANNVYNVTVRVSDGTLIDTQAIAVTVTPVNDINPVITSNGGAASAAISVAENSSAVTTVKATDADLPAQTLTYSISGGADAARFKINASTGVLSFIAAPNFEVPTDAGADNVYDVTVQASDGSLTDTQAIAVTVTNLNDNNPVLTSNGGGASAAVNVAENSVTVTTVTATDADALGALTYAISGGVDAARFTIDASSGVLSFAAAPNYEAPTDAGANNVYNVTVRVSDGTRSDTQAVAVTVRDANEFPVGAISDADATANSVAENAGVGTLVGGTALAVDPDATTNAISYTLDNSAGGRFAIDAATGVLSVAGVLDYETSTSHAVTVRATSADGSFSTAVFTIDLSDVNEFAVGAVSDADTTPNQVAENSAAGTLVGITALAVDADASAAVSYSLIDNAGGRFAIDPTSGVIVTTAALDAEAGINHNIVVRAESTDGSFNTQRFVIVLADANEFGVGALSDSDTMADAADENAAIGTLVGITASAFDLDATNSTISYTLDDSAGGRFAIDAASGVVTIAGATDREVAPSHAIVVRATSADGSFSIQGFIVAVNPVNEQPPLISSDGGGASASISVTENSSAVTTVVASDTDLPAQTLTYSIVGGADHARFNINPGTGVLSFASAPDYENPNDAGLDNIYDVTVQVSDGSLASTQAISVTVNPLNEQQPLISSDGGGASASISVTENSSAVTTVVASDADLPAQTLTYSIVGGADQARFNINPSTGVLSFASAPDYENPSDAGLDNVYGVTVQVSDGSLASTQAISVTVTPLNDRQPVISSDGGGASASISVTENSSAVTTVVASDTDLPAQALTYSIIGGADQARFNINPTTGVLSFASAPDYESPTDIGADNVYEVTVQVSDGSLASTQAISVTVNPLNEQQPVISSDGGGASASISVTENSSAVTTVVASDADMPAQALTYRIIGGADQARFNIDPSTGVLSFASAPDYENPGDAGLDNVYDVTVQVSDGSLASTQAISVTVNNLDDSAPVLGANSLTIVQGGSAIPVIAATDADSSPAQLSFTVSGLSGGHFELAAAPGVAVTVFTQADVDAGRLRFVSDGGETAPAYQLTLSDGVNSGVAQAATVSFTNTNDAPVITSNGGAPAATIAAAENSLQVTTITATDADALDVLRFAISGGADAARFSIDAVSGALRFVVAPDAEQPADANADNRYEVVVSVSDGSLQAQQSLSIDVVNINEAPTIVVNWLLLSRGGPTLVLLGTDQESAPDALNYAVSGVVGGQFEHLATPGAAITGFSQAEVNAGAVRFVADASGASPTYALSLSDGVSVVTAPSPDVAILPPPAPPAEPIALPSNPPPPEAPPSAAPVKAANPVAAKPQAPAPGAGHLPQDLLSQRSEDAYEPMQARLNAAASSALVADSPAIRDTYTTAVVTLDPFSVASDGSQDAAAPGRTKLDLVSALRDRLLGQELDQLHDAEQMHRYARQKLQFAAPILVGGASVGYLLWLARGGVLMASLMSALPGWTAVDPLPVLARAKRRDRKDDSALDDHDAEDALEKIFSELGKRATK